MLEGESIRTHRSCIYSINIYCMPNICLMLCCVLRIWQEKNGPMSCPHGAYNLDCKPCSVVLREGGFCLAISQCCFLLIYKIKLLE